jgi:predicted aspartyl protease
MTRKPRPIAPPLETPIAFQTSLLPTIGPKTLWGLVLSLACVSCQSPAPTPPTPNRPNLPVLPTPTIQSNRIQPLSPQHQKAIEAAQQATQLSKKAQSIEDWQTVIAQWQTAIVLMKQVPANDANHSAAVRSVDLLQEGVARSKAELSRIQDNAIAAASQAKATQALEEATQRLKEKAEPPPAKSLTYYATIKSYKSGIPVIDVTFNGNLHFEMMVDTGASSTMITESMSKALNVETITYVTAKTPSGETKFPVGYVNSIAVGNDPAQNTVQEVPVAIGPVALLGHDFFGDCNISIKRDQNIVEFSQCR